MKFLIPVPSTAVVTQTFAEHEHRRIVNGWQYYNGGIDWAIPTGTTLKAAQQGKVAELRTDATGYGTHVRINHADGYCTLYGHMMDFLVVKDQMVNPGDPIGRSDNTGNSTGPHVHFELRLNNKAIDPEPLLVRTVEELEGGMPPEPPPDGKEPKKWPVLPQVRVVSSTGLNIRSGPGITNSPVGYLPVGSVVEVLRKTSQGPDTWLQIGYKQYIALVVAGESLAVWVKV